jgi:hypothetical protein
MQPATSAPVAARRATALFKAATCEAGLHPRVDRVADDAVGEHVLDRAAVQLAPVAGHLLLAVINVAAAVVALAWRGPTALVLAWVVAVWALAAGFAEIVSDVGRDRLVSVAFGVVLAARPDIGALTLALLFGLYSTSRLSRGAPGSRAPTTKGTTIPHLI